MPWEKAHETMSGTRPYPRRDGGSFNLKALAEEVKKEFVKHDQEKPVYALIPPEFEEALAKVLTVGSHKYSDKNWQLCKTPFRTYYSALRRHLGAFARGERTDLDSGESHLAHAACCLVFLQWFESTGQLEGGTGDGAGDVPSGA